jgi:hypothetical protein
MTTDEFDFWKVIYAASVASGKRLTEARGQAEAALIDYRVAAATVDEEPTEEVTDREEFYNEFDHDFVEQT